jgi:predicted alpha/beta superfamily hydrolase
VAVPAAAETTAAASQPASAIAGVPIAAGTSYTLHSRVLGDDREVNVWLPPDYEKSKARYSVVYVVDGARDQDFPHIAGLGQLGALSGTYESLVIVGVQTRNRQHELTFQPHDARYLRAFPQGGGADDFRRFLSEEVLPFVDTHFRTGPKRALMGESLAGLFVVDTFLKTPSAFDDYIAVSPSLWWDDRALTRDARVLLAKHDASPRRLYLTLGDEGGITRHAMDELTAALKAQKASGWMFVDRAASETHATIYHGAALDAFRHFYALPPYPMGPAPWWNTEGASPP